MNKIYAQIPPYANENIIVKLDIVFKGPTKNFHSFNPEEKLFKPKNLE